MTMCLSVCVFLSPSLSLFLCVCVLWGRGLCVCYGAEACVCVPEDPGQCVCLYGAGEDKSNSFGTSLHPTDNPFQMFTAIPGGVSPSVADSTLHGAHICPARTRASSPNATRPSSLFITSTNENRGTFVLLSNRKKHTQTQTHTNVSPSPCPPPSKNTHIQT